MEMRSAQKNFIDTARLQDCLEAPRLGQPMAGLAADQSLRHNEELMVEIGLVFGLKFMSCN